MNKCPGAVETKALIGILIGLVVIVAIFVIVRLDMTGEKGSGLGTDFEYSLEQLGKIDPNLILFEESAAPIDTKFETTHAVAVDTGGSIYVAGDNAVRVFDGGGNLQNEIALSEAPMALAVVTEEAGENAPDGLKIYVAMKDHVEAYNGRGKSLARWQSPGDNAVLTDIAVSKDNVFVADAGNRIVWRYDTKGTMLNRIGEKDADRNIAGFVIPSPYFDLAVGRDGLLRVVNPGVHRIEAYTFEGDLEFSWGEFSSDVKGFCGCCNPVNFAILPGGDPAGADDSFVTCEKGLTRVKIYGPEGDFVGVVAGPEQLVEGGKVEICSTPEECQLGGFDVAVDKAGRVIVLDTIRNIVRIFSEIKK
ncbi:MAG: hypothetical protein JW715_04800 [Sedimentisphaerales bacterium]|nr:hypothetical protein [Sedimentisphaerales bacterium]